MAEALAKGRIAEGLGVDAVACQVLLLWDRAWDVHGEGDSGRAVVTAMVGKVGVVMVLRVVRFHVLGEEYAVDVSAGVARASPHVGRAGGGGGGMPRRE